MSVEINKLFGLNVGSAVNDPLVALFAFDLLFLLPGPPLSVPLAESTFSFWHFV